jgi:hypothetical protein
MSFPVADVYKHRVESASLKTTEVTVEQTKLDLLNQITTQPLKSDRLKLTMTQLKSTGKQRWSVRYSNGNCLRSSQSESEAQEKTTETLAKLISENIQCCRFHGLPPVWH